MGRTISGLIWLAAAAAFAVAAVMLAQRMGASPDFDVFWGAQRTAHPYDPSALAAALSGRAPGEGPRYFAYPPTFMWLAWPLRLIPDLRLAYGLWVAGSCLAAMAVTGSRWSVLMLISPSVIFAGMSGQTTLLVGAAVLAGLRIVERPALAGLLLGAATCIKPQLAGLAPLFLLITPGWRAGAAAGLTVLVLAASATVAVGPQAWTAWWRALPVFLEVNQQHLAAKELIHLPIWLRGLAGVLGLTATAIIFRRRFEAPERMICACGTALVLSPHAIAYEVAGLAPAAFMIALRRDWRIAPTVLFLSLPPGQLSLAVLGAALAPVDRLLRRGRQGCLDAEQSP